jgi:hypothetical protein
MYRAKVHGQAYVDMVHSVFVDIVLGRKALVGRLGITLSRERERERERSSLSTSTTGSIATVGKSMHFEFIHL